MSPDLLILGVCWIAYGAMHSILVTTPITTWVRQRWRAVSAYYRLTYNVLSVFALIPILLFSHSIHTTPILKWVWPYTCLQYLCWALGILLFILGMRHYDGKEFLGLKQISSYHKGLHTIENHTLSRGGIHRIIRHPWYLGLLLVLWARDVSSVTLTTNSMLTMYLFVGTYLEEQKLVMKFGSNYREYQKTVPMFFPTQWLNKLRHSQKNDVSH